MDFTKEQLTLFTNFYTALEENQKDLELKEKYKIQCLEINDKITELEKKILFRNTTISSFLKGIILEKENTPLDEQQKQLIQGGDEMKYRGITIIKNTKCNTWSARPTINGKQIYLSAKTQQECYTKLKAVLNKQQKAEAKNTIKTKNKKTLTLIEWFEKWKSLYKSEVRQTTISDYNSSFKHLKQIQNIPIDKITSIQIQEEINKINGSSAKQKNYELLKMIFEKATNNELIMRNPMITIDKPKYKRINGNALTNEDEKQLEQLLKQNNDDYFLVCLYQGLRRGECLALTINDIDFNNKTITINKSVNVNDKIDKTKKYYSIRIIPLFEQTEKILTKYKNITGRIFPFTIKKVQNKFKEYSDKFSMRYTIHSLRHTFITKCQEQNIPLHIIQKWVGHVKGSNITQNVYTHARQEIEAENIRKMNNLFY